MRKTVFLKDRNKLNQFSLVNTEDIFLEKPKKIQKTNENKINSNKTNFSKTKTEIKEEKPKQETPNFMAQIKQEYPLFNEVFETKLSMTPLNNEEENSSSSSDDIFIKPISFDPNIAVFNEQLKSNIEEKEKINQIIEKEREEDKIDPISFVNPQYETEFYFLGYEYEGMDNGENVEFNEYEDNGFTFYENFNQFNGNQDETIKALKETLTSFREEIKEISKMNAKNTKFTSEETGFPFTTERQSPLIYRDVLVPKERPNISLFPTQNQKNYRPPNTQQSKWNTFGTSQNKPGFNQKKGGPNNQKGNNNKKGK